MIGFGFDFVTHQWVMGYSLKPKTYLGTQWVHILV
jgi:hypothetical protein